MNESYALRGNGFNNQGNNQSSVLVSTNRMSKGNGYVGQFSGKGIERAGTGSPIVPPRNDLPPSNGFSVNTHFSEREGQAGASPRSRVAVSSKALPSLPPAMSNANGDASQLKEKGVEEVMLMSPYHAPLAGSPFPSPACQYLLFNLMQ